MKTPAQILQGWDITSIVTLQPGTPWSVQDTSNDFSGTKEGLTTRTRGEKPGTSTAIPTLSRQCPTDSPFSPEAIRLRLPPRNPLCDNSGARLGALAMASLSKLDATSRQLRPDPSGVRAIRDHRKEHFPESAISDLGFSVFKKFKIKERITAQFRAEFLNVLNHPVFGQIDSGHLANNDPSAGVLGVASETPDEASGNPVLGSGSSRDIQLGLKIIF